MERFVGGCLCGDVRFEVTGEPYRVGICHCLDAANATAHCSTPQPFFPRTR